MNDTESRPVPVIFDTEKFPSLDGIRAICIALVLFAHLCNAYTFTEGTRAFITRLGLLGVQMFFVLSGFLITTLLLKEKALNKTISLENFYIRRALRILPVVLLYVGSVFLLNAIFNFGVPAKSFAGAIFFLSNHPWFHGSWYMAHFWSLSIEEQYYLVFPFILKRAASKTHLLLFLMLSFIIAVKAFPVPASFPFANTFMLLVYQSDGVLVGSLAAIACFKEQIPFTRIIKCNPLLILPVALLIILFQTELKPALYPVNSTISSLLIAFLLIFVMINKQNWLYNFLNNKYVVLIGKLSFSIYVWQQLFTSSDGRLGSIAHLPKNILLIAIAGYISYTFFESIFCR